MTAAASRTGSRELNDAERLDWLRLARCENVGPATFFALLTRFGSVAAALDALPSLARAGGRERALNICSRTDAERELAVLAKNDARLVAYAEPDYPALLATIEDPPPVLALSGHAALAAKPTVAVIGARNASANARRFTERLAQDLGEAGFVVVSGLARGIDASAHQGSLERGTIGVIGCGIDVVYPPEHAKLQADVATRGLLVAEMPPGTPPIARNFPRRNRIISGMSLGVVVVEAAERSGSLITARMAGDQGREVFAVPGSPLDERCRGTNGLLRDGAHLVETIADIVPVLRGSAAARADQKSFDFIAPPARSVASEEEKQVESARQQILELLDPHPVQVDELIRRCQLSPGVILTVLLELELAGRLERHSGNRVSLLSP